MKLKFVSIALAMTVLSSMAQARNCGNAPDPDPADVFLGLVTTTTAPPLTITSLIACAIVDSAEVNNAMIQKEASMLIEENKIFVPSFLGAYADQKNIHIREAAQDVLVNGVR